MSYTLDGVDIRRPSNIEEGNSTLMAQNRSLQGTIKRDYFGANKRSWKLEYQNVTKADYDIIKAIYDDYLTDGIAKTWAVSETNYTISSINVHLDSDTREFSVKGSGYISDFSLILTEE